jgi:hypothetical protein
VGKRPTQSLGSLSAETGTVFEADRKTGVIGPVGTLTALPIVFLDRDLLERFHDLLRVVAH